MPGTIAAKAAPSTPAGLAGIASPGSMRTVAEALSAALRHRQAGEFLEAESIYREIIAVQPDLAEAQDALGTILVARGQPAEARARYERAILIKPDFAEAYYHLGNILMSEGMVADAVAHYELALRFKPDFAAALHARWHATGFFRDLDVFELLRAEISQQSRTAIWSRRNQFRIWVPACSTGQEAYSLAIVINEALSGMSGMPALEVIGTDISVGALQHARTGYYRGNPLGTIKDKRLERFFVPANGGYTICDSIRRICAFRRHNLSTDAPIREVDLISCRNVLSFFFDPNTQGRVLEVLHGSLLPGGYLVLGRGESLRIPDTLFLPVDRNKRVFRRR
jgi:chemotaxis methyl-accepting protein methylase